MNRPAAENIERGPAIGPGPFSIWCRGRPSGGPLHANENRSKGQGPWPMGLRPSTVPLIRDCHPQPAGIVGQHVVVDPEVEAAAGPDAERARLVADEEHVVLA